MSLGGSVALVVGLAGAIVVACYEVPRPDCGFICGPESACPDDYTCADDHHCHRIGAPADLVCGGADAAVDARPSDGMPDAPLDAMPDAMVDAMPDATVDAPE